MIYLASPFFNKFEEKVKKDMIEAVENCPYFTYPTLFNPEDSEVSSEYGKGGASAKKEDRFRLAKAIYLDNIRGIENSSILVYPKWTTDAGTLFEVGFALGLGKKIYRYNFLTKELEPTPTLEVPYEGRNINPHRVINTVGDIVTFGFLASHKEFHDRLSYRIISKTMKDNLMLAANFKLEVIDSGDKCGLINPEDRNWEGIL